MRSSDLPAELQWRTSSRSLKSYDWKCVQTSTLPRTFLVRDSKDPSGPVLAFSSAAGRAFIAFAAEQDV